jgi:hypothetical protein
MKEAVTLERETFLNSLRRVSLCERQIELDQAQLQQEQHRHHREYAGSRRSEGIAPVAYKGREFSIAFNPEVPDWRRWRNLSARTTIFLDRSTRCGPRRGQ